MSLNDPIGDMLARIKNSLLRNHKKVQLPSYKTKVSSGMDLIAFIDNPIKISPNTSALISTGISIAIPE